MMTSTRLIEFDTFHITARYDWDNITSSLEELDTPFTVAKKDQGVGAIQFSTAIYLSGPIPSPRPEDLRTMLAEFEEHRCLGQPYDTAQFSGDVFGIGSSYHSCDDFVRAWYLSDGRNFMLVTYVCDWCKRFEESEECEEIVRSVRFKEKKET